MSRLAGDLEDKLKTTPGAEAETDGSKNYVVIEEVNQDGEWRTTVIGEDASYQMDRKGAIVSHPFNVNRDGVVDSELARANKRAYNAFSNGDPYALCILMSVAKSDLPFDIPEDVSR